MRWADTTQGARTHRKEVRKIEHPASGVEESPTYETESCSLHDQNKEDRSQKERVQGGSDQPCSHH